MTGTSLDAWVLETLPRALGYARSLVSNRAQAEDIVHDCYVRLLEKADIYDLPRDGWKLLLRSVTNASIDQVYRRREMVRLDDQAIEPGKSADVVDARAWEPIEELSAREMADAIDRGLDRLPVLQRAALQLKLAGQTLQEIADALGTTGSHAGVLIHRARNSLAASLGHLLEDHSP